MVIEVPSGAPWVVKMTTVVTTEAVVKLQRLFRTELARLLSRLNAAGVMKLLRPFIEPTSVTILVVTCVLRHVRGTG